MDLARNPSAPDGNPEMADAPLAPMVPTEIRRLDYTPFGWLVPRLELDFALGLTATRVTATLHVERNPAAAPESALRLNGGGRRADQRLDDGRR